MALKSVAPMVLRRPLKHIAAAGLRISTLPSRSENTAMRTEVCCSASTPRSRLLSTPLTSESAANSITWRLSGVRMPRETSITVVGWPLG